MSIFKHNPNKPVLVLFVSAQGKTGRKCIHKNGMQERDHKDEQLQRMSRHLLHDEREWEECVWECVLVCVSMCVCVCVCERERERESRQWSISINCQDDVSLRHTSTLSSRKSEQDRRGAKIFSLLPQGQFHHHFMSRFCNSRFTLLFLQCKPVVPNRGAVNWWQGCRQSLQFLDSFIPKKQLGVPPST